MSLPPLEHEIFDRMLQSGIFFPYQWPPEILQQAKMALANHINELEERLSVLKNLLPQIDATIEAHHEVNNHQEQEVLDVQNPKNGDVKIYNQWHNLSENMVPTLKDVSADDSKNEDPFVNFQPRQSLRLQGLDPENQGLVLCGRSKPINEAVEAVYSLLDNAPN